MIDSELRRRYGEPALLRWEGDVVEAEMRLATYDPERTHDVTLFITNDDRLALIRKPHFAEGIWRPPGGGVHPGEDVRDGIVREALEETGLAVEPIRYLVLVEAIFRHAGVELAWRTHVVHAVTGDEELAPRDLDEIAAARWGTLAELAGPLRNALLATGRAFWRYRVALHDAALAELGYTPRPAGQRRGMAEVSPIDIQRHLGGIDYPASKSEIVEQARASGADDDVLSRLEGLPDREYDGPTGVMKELGGEF